MSEFNFTKIEFIAENEQDTENLANLLAECIVPGTYICLTGNLGAGKTTFTRSFAEKLGVKEQVTSPTFVLQKIYDLPESQTLTHFIHYDAYRLHSFEELLDLGFEDHPATSVIVVEWGEKYFPYFPEPKLQMTILRLDEYRRCFQIQGLNLAQQEFLQNSFKKS